MRESVMNDKQAAYEAHRRAWAAAIGRPYLAKADSLAARPPISGLVRRLEA